jgi:hypothetical protein
MSDQGNDVFNFRGEKVTVGLSQILGVTGIAGQNSAILKYYSGGSLEIGGPSLTWAGGYLVSTSEVLSLNSYATFYLVASGATVVTYLLRGLSVNNT